MPSPFPSKGETYKAPQAIAIAGAEGTHSPPETSIPEKPMRKALGVLSRAIGSRLPGALPNSSVCAWIAGRWGAGCLFCRVVGSLLRERTHCQQEQDWLTKK